MRIDYNALLYEKVKKEYDAFVESLEKLSPKDIIDSSYEKVFKEDIVLSFENISLEQIEAKALFKKKNPLDFVYQEWLKNDCSYMDMLRDTVEDSSKKAVRNMREMMRDSR